MTSTVHIPGQRRALLQDPTCPRDTAGRPRAFTAGRGAWLVDAGGESWLDLDGARGSVLLGHADERVAAAVAEAAGGLRGTATGWSPALDEVVERLAALLPGQVAGLFRTGTAAVRAAACAVRAARGGGVLLSAGYHGYDPMWWPAAEPFEPNADGVIDWFYDLEALAGLLAGHDVAAVVLAPDHVHLGPGWYRDAGRITGAAGVPVVLDEVKTGLRYRPGLSVAAGSLAADVWVVAKGVANGLPLAAVGGDPRLLAAVEAMSYTSFFEPTVLAAACATLEAVATGDVQRRITEAGERIADHAAAELRRRGVPVEVAGRGPLFQFVCADDEVAGAFHAAAARQRLLLYEGDNQAPSAAFDREAQDAAARRLAVVCAELEGMFEGREVGEGSRYRAAWNLLDGLPDLPRSPGAGRRWVDRLLAAP